MSGMIQSLLLIVFGLILIAILLKVLLIVHKQAGRLKELETEVKLTKAVEDNEVKIQGENNG